MPSQPKAISNKLDKEIAAFLGKRNAEESDTESKTSISYDEFLTNKMLIIKAIRAGIPYSLFDLIQDHSPLSEEDWADFLDISTKSLQRYKATPEHHFKPIHSEKIIEIAEVIKVGLDVFGQMEKFKLWLNTPNFALGKMKPIELLKDSYGKEMVIGELVRINHGIFV